MSEEKDLSKSLVEAVGVYEMGKCVEQAMYAMQRTKQYKIAYSILLSGLVIYFVSFYFLAIGMYVVAFVLAVIAGITIASMIMSLHVMTLSAIICEEEEREMLKDCIKKIKKEVNEE